MLPCIDCMRPVLRRVSASIGGGPAARSAAAASADRGGHPVEPDLGGEFVLGIVDQERERQQRAVSGPDDSGEGMHLAECPGLRPNDAPAGQGCVVEKPDPEGALDPGNGQAGDQRTELWVLVPGGKSEQSGQGVGWHLRLSSKPTPVSDLAALMPGAELDQLLTDGGNAVRGGATAASTDRGLPQHDFGVVVVAGHQDLFDYALQRPGGYGREVGR